ncbi:MAG: HAMP domain-containing histidine kinase [Candidatus Eremiobacteraeota bacterium]|nr:HAMP domain-containing histidine kinase [Candidatus Eremiobacteraeota bacterium]
MRLRSQIVGILFLLFCVAIFSVAYLNISLLTGTLESLSREQAEGEALMIGQWLEQIIPPSYFKDEYTKLDISRKYKIGEYIRRLHNIRCLDVFDRYGRRLYNYTREGQYSVQINLRDRALETGIPLMSLVAYRDEDDRQGDEVQGFTIFEKRPIAYEYYYPVLSRGRPVAVIHISLGVTRVNWLLRIMFAGNMLLTIIFLLTAYLAISIWGENAINRPLRFILDAQEKLGRGDFGAQVELDVNPANEMVQISNSFNRMVGELKKIQIQLQDKTRHLEELNKEYHRLNESLEDEVEKKTRELRDFFSIITHDLKVPLAAVQGYTDLLLKSGKEKLGEKNYHFVRNISIATRNLLQLVRNMLDSVKYEAHKIRYYQEDFDLHDVIEEIRTNLQLLIEEKGIKFVIDLPPFCRMVYGDRGKIGQVLGNLISNAMDHTPGSGEIRVSGRAKGETIEVEVSDTGPGIPPEQIDKVFDKFAHFSRTGSGLGLYIVRQIIEGHGQKVWIESSEGKGTSFFFTLARARKREEASPLMGN